MRRYRFLKFSKNTSMIKKLRFILLFGFLILRGITLFGQDPVFSQFFASPLQLNPAFAGNAYAPFIALNYRMQYPAFNGSGAAYSTFAASYDQHLEGLNSGIGFSLMADDAGQGIYKKTYTSVHYSYKVSINKNLTTRIGVEAGFIQANLDWNKLIFLDQIGDLSNPDAPLRPTNEVPLASNSRNIFDMSTGFLIYGSGFHAGISAKHLATPNEGFINANQNLRIGLPTRWTIHGGYEIVLKRATRYAPANYITPLLMHVRQGDFSQTILGASGGFGYITGGLMYRHSGSQAESIISMIGFKQDYFKIGYSYDYSVGGLFGQTGGSHEISVTINLDPYAGKKVDINDCFKIFR
jgi:type IX secretion system PorP/SprF family membrane protein